MTQRAPGEGRGASKGEQSLFARRRARITGHDVQLAVDEEPPSKRARPAASPAGAAGTSRSTAGVWVNRAPVLVLWTAVVAQRQGHSWEAGTTFGRAVAALCAQAKGKRIGVYAAQGEGGGSQAQEGQEAEGGQWVKVRAVEQEGELRAVQDGKPVSAQAAHGYLEHTFRGRLEDAKAVLEGLAAAYAPEDLEDAAFGMYEHFRPSIPEGQQGWGRPGMLDLEALVKRTQDRQKEQAMQTGQG